MDKEGLIELIKTGEGITLELKENVSNNLGKVMCAFANAQGGKIILGVNDSKEIVGIKTTNSLKSQIHDYARNIDPSIVVDIGGVKDVLVIYVSEGNKKPYSVNGQFFLRIGANCQQLNREEIRDFFQKENLVLFDKQLNKDFDLKEDFNKEKFKEFLALAKITDNGNEKNILRNLFLLKEEYLKNAGVLFFCRNVKKFFIGATITCVLYQGRNKTNILDRKEFDADIFSNYNDALVYLISKLNTHYIIKRERVERMELPEEALREAIINAIVHRDYLSTGHVQIDIYLDRVEISNPGGLVKGLSKKDFGKVSLPRNPLLMDLMLRINRVEKIGSGIKRIKDAMRTYGLNVKFQSSEFFTVTFQRADIQAGHRLGEKLGEKLGENQSRIIQLISENKTVSITEIASFIGISTTAVENNISKLKRKRIIKRVGPDKGGHWEIIKE